MKRLASSITRGFSTLLIPPSCPRCGARVEGREIPCSCCDEELAGLWNSLSDVPEVADLSAPFPFLGAARDLIHRAKYEGNRPAADLLGKIMAARLLIDLCGIRDPLLLPVPLHRTRLRQRGFNQAERLACAAARAARCGLRTDILVRVRASASQTTLDLDERRASVAGAFAARGRPPDRPLVLVDDVWTTGATAEACRGALRQAGAGEVIRVLVAARTLSRFPCGGGRQRSSWREPK